MNLSSCPFHESYFLNSLVASACAYFKKVSPTLEVQCSVPQASHRLALHDFTVLITLEWDAPILCIMTFDRPFIAHLHALDSEGLNLDSASLQQAWEETAAECANILVGHAMAAFNHMKHAIHLSPPLVMTEAKNRQSVGQVQHGFFSDIQTNYGMMSVYCMASGQEKNGEPSHHDCG